MPHFTARLSAALAALLLAGAVHAQTPSSTCPPSAPDPASLRIENLRADVRDRGFLWKADRDGRTSWLYGTMHIGRSQWVMPGPQLVAAFQATDVLALELDPSAADLPGALARRLDPARTARVLENLQPAMREALRKACLPDSVAAMPPLMQLMMVMLSEARRADLHPEFGSENVLVQGASVAGRRVVALESIESQLASILPDSEEEERELVRRSLSDLDSADGIAVLRQLADIWAAGDEALLADYPKWCKCTETAADRRALRRLMDERNAPMADKVAAMHAQGQRVFVAVGALHMVGEQGLPALLRARGFTVRRVPFPRTP